MLATEFWRASSDPFWVFAYGSLMWDPCFEYDERQPALLGGYRRSLCIWSTTVRGTGLQPGLVLGLRAGPACEGLAFQISPSRVTATLLTLANREFDSSAYIPRFLPVRLSDSRQVLCLVFVANATSRHFASNLTPARIASIVSRATGVAGPNLDYVRRCWNACCHLSITDAELHDVVAALPLAPE